MKGYKTGEKALRPEQVESLIKSIDKLEDLALFKLALAAGIRREDIARLKWTDVHFPTKSLSFYESKKDRVRKVYLGSSVVTTFQMLRKQNQDKNYIFVGESEAKYNKGHITGRTAYNRFQHYLVKAGIQKLEDRRPFHALRATCIKLCQAKGWTAEETAKHVGDTIRVIQEHYSTPSDEEMRHVAEEKAII